MNEWDDFRKGSIGHVILPYIGLDLKEDFFDSIFDSKEGCSEIQYRERINPYEKTWIIAYNKLLDMFPECDFEPTSIWIFEDFY